MVPRLRELFRQGQAEVVSNSKNKILATWEPFFWPGPVHVRDALHISQNIRQFRHLTSVQMFHGMAAM